MWKFWHYLLTLISFQTHKLFFMEHIDKVSDDRILGWAFLLKQIILEVTNEFLFNMYITVRKSPVYSITNSYNNSKCCRGWMSSGWMAICWYFTDPANLICFSGHLISTWIAVITRKALMFSQLTVSRI